jgi:hypothetical protein
VEGQRTLVVEDMMVMMRRTRSGLLRLRDRHPHHNLLHRNNRGNICVGGFILTGDSAPTRMVPAGRGFASLSDFRGNVPDDDGRQNMFAGGEKS